MGGKEKQQQLIKPTVRTRSYHRLRKPGVLSPGASLVAAADIAAPHVSTQAHRGRVFEAGDREAAG